LCSDIHSAVPRNTVAAAEKNRVSYKAFAVARGILGETNWQKALCPLVPDDIRGRIDNNIRVGKIERGNINTSEGHEVAA
jgi:hypothetical protein